MAHFRAMNFPQEMGENIKPMEKQNFCFVFDIEFSVLLKIHIGHEKTFFASYMPKR